MCDNVRKSAEEYFASLNSMANRIMVDASSANFGCHGDEYFAPRHIRDKYAFYLRTNPEVDCIPKLCIRSGEKYVVDDDSHGKGSGCSWRDEHSGPFIWETQSQLDLSLIGTENVVPKNANELPVAVNDNDDDDRGKKESSAPQSPPKVSPKKISQYRTESDFRGGNVANGGHITNGDAVETQPTPPPPSMQSPSRVVLTKRMEKQLSGKCFNKAPATGVVLPPLPDRPPPVVSTGKSSASTAKSPSQKSSSRKSPLKKPTSPPEPPKTKQSQSPGASRSATATVLNIAAPTPTQTPCPADTRASFSASASKIDATESVVTAQVELAQELRSLEIYQSPSEDIPKTGFDFLDNW